jgi:hypothetical protein
MVSPPLGATRASEFPLVGVTEEVGEVEGDESELPVDFC